MNKGREPQLVHRKIVVMGSRAVGKSSMIVNYVSNSTLLEPYHPTIETTHSKTIRFRKVHFETDIVDTAGMDEYSRLSRNASLGVHGYILCFSIASRQSYDMIQQINDALLSTLGNAPDVPRILVGTNGDKAETRQVSFEDAERLAGTWRIPYIECSSLTGENVAEVFHTLMKEVEKGDGLLAERGQGGCLVQ